MFYPFQNSRFKLFYVHIGDICEMTLEWLSIEFRSEMIIYCHIKNTKLSVYNPHCSESSIRYGLWSIFSELSY